MQKLKLSDLKTDRDWAIYNCQRKRRFKTRESAGNVRRQMVRMGKSNRHGLVSFKCDICHGWHNGHLPREIREAMWEAEAWAS